METPEQAIVREFEEETGLKVKVDRLLPYIATNYWDYEWGKQQTLCFVFVCSFVKEVPHKKDHHVNKYNSFYLRKYRIFPHSLGLLKFLKWLKSSIQTIVSCAIFYILFKGLFCCHGSLGQSN